MADRITINSVDLSRYGRVEQIWDNVLGAPELRGGPETVPRRPGEIDAAPTPGGRTFGVGMLLHGASASLTDGGRKQFAQNWVDLAAMLWSPRTPLTIQRTLDLPSGTTAKSAQGRYIGGLSPDMASESKGRVTLNFRLLDPYWYDTADTTINPGTVTVAGQADTRRMTITLPAAGTLTNTTLSVSVVVSAATTLTVESFTSSAGIDKVTSHSGDDFWFLLAPGSNTITWSAGGTPAIAYRAAHL